MSWGFTPLLLGAAASPAVNYTLAAEAAGTTLDAPDAALRFVTLLVRGTSTSSAASTTSHSVLMPAQTVLGDVVIVTFRPGITTVVTPPANFSLLYQGDSRTAVFVSTNATAGSYTFVTSVAVGSDHAVYAVRDGLGVSAVGATGLSATPDAPLNTSAFSATSDILWVVCYGSRSGTTVDFTAAPTGYGLDTIVSGTNGYAAMSHAQVSQNLAVNPPTATAAQSAQWVAVTVGISSQLEPGSPLTAVPCAFSLTGNAAALTVIRQYTLTANVASTALTGYGAGVVRNKVVLADVGSLSVPVYDASLRYGRSLAAEAAGYTINAPPTALQVSLVISVTAASFASVGLDAALLASLQLPATVSPFTLTGFDSQCLVGVRLTADPAAFTASGVAAGLVAARRLPLVSEQFQQTAFDAGLTRTAALTAVTAALAAQPYDSGVLVGRLVAGDTSAFSLTGNAAAFPAAPTPLTLLATPASFLVAAFDAALVAGTTGPHGTGTFTATTTPAALSADRRLAADFGGVTASTSATALNAARLMVAEPAGFATGSNAVGVLLGRTVVAAIGSFALPGYDAVILRSGLVTASTATATLTFVDAGLRFGFGLTAQTSAVSLVGSDTRLGFGFGLSAQTTAIAVTGVASFFRRSNLTPASDESVVGGEVRKTMRPIEIRTTARPIEVTGTVRPAERRTAIHR